MQAGWLAKGFIFVVIGLLGLDIARRGSSSGDADQTGALAAIAEGPFGRILVLAVGIGLALFAIWQLWTAVTGASEDLLDVLKRIGSAGLGIVYGMLAITGIEIAIRGSSASSQSQGGATSPDGIANLAFQLPAGRWVVAAIGVGTIAVGAYHLRKGAQFDFLDDVDTDDLSDEKRRTLAGLGVVGFFARALMLALAGALFLVAAWQFDPNEAAGLDQSLRTLTEFPAGRFALAAASLGLVSAGAYDMTTFRRQRLDNGSDS